MYVENTNTGFAIHDLNADQLELIQHGLILLQKDLPKQTEFIKQHHECADMFLKMDVELVKSRENANCCNG